MFNFSARQQESLSTRDRERFMREALATLGDLRSASAFAMPTPPVREEVEKLVDFFGRSGFSEEKHVLVLLAVFTVFRGDIADLRLAAVLKELLQDPGHAEGEKVHAAVLLLPRLLQRALVERIRPWPAS